MNRRELVSSVLDPNSKTPYIPAAFFIHFKPNFHRGQAAINKHLEYFQVTGMDFVKIQYETRFPLRPEISCPDDWSKMPLYREEFYADLINVAKNLVDATSQDSLVIMTLFSPFMCAGHTVGKTVLVDHLEENPEKTKKGIEIITESLMLFVQGCIDIGIDGFYHSTQGGETHRFEGSPIFDECIKPYDLALMEEIDQSCEFNILHICDYEGGYTDLKPFLDYPGHVVNSSLKLNDTVLTGHEISTMFDRPFMGGLDRHGIITSGSDEEIREAVISVCQSAPEKFILGADCTLPSDINWNNIKTAIETAHTYR